MIYPLSVSIWILTYLPELTFIFEQDVLNKLIMAFLWGARFYYFIAKVALILLLEKFNI